MNLLKGIIAVILSTLFGSCYSQQGIVSVQADEFEKAINANQVQLIDVRSAGEFSEGHIAYARNIDMQQSDFIVKAKALLDSKKPVYVYCHSGRRSMMAANMLKKEGFEVVNLRGGITEWEQAGKPVAP